MTVTIETLAIGNKNGPVIYVVVRRVGKHLDIEEMPDEVTNSRQAHAYAAKRWNVPECDIVFTPIQIVPVSGDPR